MLYGDDWELVLNGTTYMEKNLCIRNMLRHMAVESDRLMVGTCHEGKVLFKHGALVLVSAKETREWTRTKIVNKRSLFSRWLLPEAVLNNSIAVNGTVTKRYRERPPGNLPWHMSLDEFGNTHMIDGVNRHISATKQLERWPDVETDPKYEF